MRKFTFVFCMVVAQFPVVVFGSDVDVVGRASSGGTTVIRATASGASQMTIEGSSRRGGITEMVGRADGDAKLSMQGDSRGHGSRVNSRASVSGRRGGAVDARSVNQAIDGQSFNELTAHATDGGLAIVDQVTTSRLGRAESMTHAEAIGGTVDQVNTVVADRGVARGRQSARSVGAGAVTLQELLVDGFRGSASGAMSADTSADSGSAVSDSLGVVRGGPGGSVHSDSILRTRGVRATATVESNFFHE